MPDSSELLPKSDRQLVIGAVGHRTLPASRDAIVQQIVDVLQELLRTDQRRPVSLMSSVAEGADRHLLGAAATLNLPYDLVLPCPPDCFLEDFTSAASRSEFEQLQQGARRVLQPDGDPSKEAGYLWASEIILDHADTLLAVWDGGPGNGLAGTAETIQRALDRGIPVYWIRADASEAATLLEPRTEARAR